MFWLHRLETHFDFTGRHAVLLWNWVKKNYSALLWDEHSSLKTITSLKVVGLGNGKKDMYIKHLEVHYVGLSINLGVLILNDVLLNNLFFVRKYNLEGSSEFINKLWLCPYCVFSTSLGDQQMFIEQWARTENKKVMATPVLISLSDWKRHLYGKTSVKCAILDVCQLCIIVEANCRGLSWCSSICWISRNSCTSWIPLHVLRETLLRCAPQSHDNYMLCIKSKGNKEKVIAVTNSWDWELHRGGKSYLHFCVRFISLEVKSPCQRIYLFHILFVCIYFIPVSVRVEADNKWGEINTGTVSKMWTG